ncbi:acylphosphatase [Haliovirga abyssi]|uniref:acylphosphatase n=1 Tax=Haliovirga abyssi TaxID=2996794 RepID=A0AAU9DCH0_9FUSO|nr:acylphosphatase [Haliovirga abyssi]BDU51010.1 acylphosphatase [Haliovirga abyssi]
MKRLIVKGRVQGVGFRYFTEILASEYGAKGYVKNLFNGDVEIIISNENEIEYKQFKNKIIAGNSMSEVDKLVEEEYYGEKYNKFTIKY